MKNTIKNIYILGILIILILPVTLLANGSSWQKEYLINGNVDSFANCLIQTSDNNFIFAGFALHDPFPNSILIVKINVNGDTIWTRKYRIQSYQALSIVNSPDGGVIICGVGLQAFLLKYTASGELVWFKQYGFGHTNFYKIKMISDMSLIACGSSENDSAAVFKFDTNGNLIWSKFFNHDFKNELYDFIEVNKKLTFVGYSISSGLSQFVYFLQSDLNGNVLIENNLSIPINTIIEGRRIIFINNYFKIYGSTFNKSNGLTSSFFLKTTIDGVVFGSKIFLDTYKEELFDVQTFNDKDLFLTNISVNQNTTYSKFTIIDTAGNIIKKLALSGNGNNSLNSICKINNREFMSAGYSTLLNINPDKPFVIKTDTSLFIKTDIVNNTSLISNFSIKAFPNPFNNSTKIQFSIAQTSRLKLEVFDVTGKLIKQIADQFFNTGIQNIDYSQAFLSSGIFFLVITENNDKSIFTN